MGAVVAYWLGLQARKQIVGGSIPNQGPYLKSHRARRPTRHCSLGTGAAGSPLLYTHLMKRFVLCFCRKINPSYGFTSPLTVTLGKIKKKS